MNVLFFGYSQLGARAVDVLCDRGDVVSAVVTHRDDPSEHRWYQTPADVADRRGLRVIFTDDLGPAGDAREALARLAERLRPDLILSVFFRELLPQRVLDAPRLAALNLHPSYLPAYRGRAPINWVLVNGETSTGVTLHHMTRRADAGDIVAQRRVPIQPRDTALSLYQALERAGVELLEEVLPQVADGSARRLPQDQAQATTFGRRRPEDGRIDWSWPAMRIDRLVRAVAPPWPGAFFDRDGRRIVVEAGEPAEAFAPGTVSHGHIRSESNRVLVAAGDGWFRLDKTRGLDLTDKERHP